MIGNCSFFSWRRRRAFILLPGVFASDLAWAQSNTDEAAAQACCGTMVGSMAVSLLIIVGAIALNIALLVWVARDAKARGMDSSVLWMLLVLFTSVIGLMLYIFSRPQGQLRQCDSCRNNRLSASKTCPHCGNE